MNLILGQGLAGSVLAIRLLQRGERIMIVDNAYTSSSSKVAAGLWNPIVFRRINKSWMADEFCSELEVFYPEMERKFNSKFYHPKSLWRMHSSALESDLWKERITDLQYAQYITQGHGFTQEFPLIDEPPFGSGFVRHAGHLDLPEFLTAACNYFVNESLYHNDTIHLPATSYELDNYEYRGIKPLRIFDCRGNKSAEDPLFSWLPFGLTKGEVLTVRCTDLPLNDILNAGFFLCPLGDDLFRLGATFNWKDNDTNPTDEGKDELLQKLYKWLNVKVEIVDHKAGIRPTVQDRRPLIGKHPVFSKLFIFNGLGTKGVMLAPWLSKHFCDNLLEGVELLPEINIDRFSHLIGQNQPLVNYPNS